MTVSPPPDVVHRIVHERIAWICTLRRDGSPHVTPIWFVFRDPTWWIGSSERNVKVRNIGSDARVSIALEGGLHPVVAEGKAAVRRSDFPPDVVAEFASKYDGWNVLETWEGFGARVKLEVPTSKWLLAGTFQ